MVQGKSGGQGAGAWGRWSLGAASGPPVGQHDHRNQRDGGIANYNAITGWQQQTIDGVPQGKPSSWTGDAYPLLPLPPIQWDSAWASPHFGNAIQKPLAGSFGSDAAVLGKNEGSDSLVRAFFFQLTS